MPRARRAPRRTTPAPKEMTNAHKMRANAGLRRHLAERKRQAEQRASDHQQADGEVPETVHCLPCRSRPDQITAVANAPEGKCEDQLRSSGNTGIGMKSTPSSARLLASSASPRHRCRAHRSRRNGSCALLRRICRRHSRHSRALFRPAPSARASACRCCSPMASAIFSCLRPVETAGAISAFSTLCEPQVGHSTSRASSACRSRHCCGTSASNSCSCSQTSEKRIKMLLPCRLGIVSRHRRRRTRAHSSDWGSCRAPRGESAGVDLGDDHAGLVVRRLRR